MSIHTSAYHSRPARYPEDDWVSVDDRLPHSGETVSVCDAVGWLTWGIYADGRWVDAIEGTELEPTHWKRKSDEDANRPAA